MAFIPALLSSLVGAATGGSGSAQASGNQPNAASDGQFKSLVAALTAKGQNIGGLSASSTTSASGAAQSAVSQFVGANVAGNDAHAQLLDRIKTLLQNGVSLSQIVSTLATNLAQQVGAVLGKTDDASLGNLKAAFASALSPPGNGPPDPAALVARLRSISSVVAKVLGTSTGQQNRLPGNTLDANTAGGNPAPNQTQTTANVNTAPASGTQNASATQALSPGSILSTALAALNGAIDPPQPAAGAQAPQSNAGLNASATNVASNGTAPADTPSTTPSPVSTDALVASSSLDAAGTGGGTLLGRTLTRAANAAADLGANPLWPVVNGPSTPSSSALTLSGGSNRTPNDARGSTTQGGGNAATTATTVSTSSASSSASTQTIMAFLNSFQKALAADVTTSGTAQTNGQDQSTDPATIVTSTPSNGNAQPFLASIGAVVNDNQNTQASTTQTPVPQQTTPNTDPNGVVDQLLRGIGMRDLGQSSEVRLRLVPESLGDLSVKLTVDHSGSVNASVIAHTPQARDALIANQNQLTRSLADAGLKLTGFSVNLSNSGANFFGQQQPQQQQSRFGSGSGPIVASVSGAGDDPLLAVPSFAPPALAVAGAGSLNYLV